MRYFIKEQNGTDDWTHFSINTFTGQVTTTKAFDWEEKNYYLIEVEARDGMEGHTGRLDHRLD